MFKLFGFGIVSVFIIHFAIASENIDLLNKSTGCEHYFKSKPTSPQGTTGPQGATGPKGDRGQSVVGPTGLQGASGALSTNSASFFRAASTLQPVSIDPSTFILFDTPRYSSPGITPSSSTGTMVYPPPVEIALLKGNGKFQLEAGITTYDTFTVNSSGIYQIAWSFNSIPNAADNSGDTLLIANLCKNGTPIPPNPNVQQSCIVGFEGNPLVINSFLYGSVSIVLENQDYIQLQVSGVGNPNIEPFANISQATITITQIGLSP
jgi:hypothetical protein